jgi:signal transduction histidine kinase
MLIAAISILLISILANLFLEIQFKNYVTAKLEEKNSEIICRITSQYNPSDNTWNIDVIENIGIDAMGSGIIINIKNNNNKVIWDAMNFNKGECHTILYNLSENMSKRYRNWGGKYINKIYPLIQNGKDIGTVTIGYYGPFYYSNSDLSFLAKLNKLFVLAGIISLLAALFLGILISNRLSKPILKVINTAKMISKGDYKTRSTEKSNIKEINTLIKTINNLGENLEMQENLRERLTSDVAHELRTPITIVQSHFEAIIDGDWEPTIDRIKSLNEEILRLSRLVGDLERLGQYESDNIILYKSDFNMDELIKDTINIFEADCLNKNINITFKGDNVIINADKDKIRQVLINLISNAIKYTPKDGNIFITTNSHNEQIEILIKDTGIGIPKEDLPFIFERFYRVEKSRNRSTGGAGIGLTITKSIIEAHKGSILVKSELNKGTEFKIYLLKL